MNAVREKKVSVVPFSFRGIGIGSVRLMHILKHECFGKRKKTQRKWLRGHKS